MTSMVKLAMIVLMPRLDRRFFSIRLFAHFTRLIVSSYFQFFQFLLRLLDTLEVQAKHVKGF
ncbi:hypothetical protein AUF78_04510 [archaeon 13_1_20CM_2_51_12]|nr:MAG: hypothetical protein AUF78_04510 [archaeon 13_1_20CM_2_51_12]